MKNDYKVCGDVTIIYAKRKGGSVHEILIDTDDLPKANSFKGSWCVDWRDHMKTFYVKGCNKDTGTIYLHRFLTDAPKEFVVDHINHDGLDNRRCNLRVITFAQNLQNRRGAQPNNRSSGVRGVTWHKQRKKWQAQARLNNKEIYLGMYETIEEAEAVVKEFRTKYMPYSQDAMNA